MNTYNQLPVDRILSGDCIEVLKRLPEASIDLVVTDPPVSCSLSGSHRAHCP